MRVTPLNIMRFWKRLMFPPDRPDYFLDRVSLKADLPWEPWLHATVWVAVIVTLFFGEVNLTPPSDVADWVWAVFGLLFPAIGFFSVWMLEYGTGRVRYIGIWSRTVADAGLSMAILAYLFNRMNSGMLGKLSIMGDAVLLASAWFTLTLVKRDIKFIVATERLADAIYYRHSLLEGDNDVNG